MALALIGAFLSHACTAHSEDPETSVEPKLRPIPMAVVCIYMEGPRRVLSTMFRMDPSQGSLFQGLQSITPMSGGVVRAGFTADNRLAEGTLGIAWAVGWGHVPEEVIRTARSEYTKYKAALNELLTGRLADPTASAEAKLIFQMECLTGDDVSQVIADVARLFLIELRSAFESSPDLLASASLWILGALGRLFTSPGHSF